MDQFNHIVSIIALTMGVAWASGINLYATLLVLGILGNMGYLDLPPSLAIVADPLIIAAAGFMYFVEFFADKTPGVDTGWDTLHTFIRIPAGAALAAGAVGELDPAVAVAAAIIGGSITAGPHATKAGTRVLINASPEPVSNWMASFAEDLAVIGGLFVALHYPWLFIIFMVAFILLMAWALPKLWKGIKHLFAHLGRLIGRDRTSTPSI